MVRFYYLDKRVKGEAIRLALVVGGLPFEDVRCSYEDVAAMRASGVLPFSQVPALQLVGNAEEEPPMHAQSQALLRWAGRRGGLYPDAHALRIDAVTDTIVELYNEMIKAGYGSAMTRHPVTGRPMVPLTPAQRAEVARCCGEVLFPARFQQLERLLLLDEQQRRRRPPPGDAAESPPPPPSGGGGGDDDDDGRPCFFCGDLLTIADLSFYVLASAILAGAWQGNGVGPSVLGGCDRLLRIVRAIADHPRVAAWNAAHPAEWFG